MYQSYEVMQLIEQGRLEAESLRTFCIFKINDPVMSIIQFNNGLINFNNLFDYYSYLQPRKILPTAEEQQFIAAKKTLVIVITLLSEMTVKVDVESYMTVRQVRN